MSAERPARAAPSNPTSRSLIALVRERDSHAWDRLVTLYAPLVFHYCRRSRLSQEDAADVFQEVFQTTYAKIERFERRRPGDSFRAWLATITQNKITDLYRRQAKEPRPVGGTELQLQLSNTCAPEVVDGASSNADGDADRAESAVLHAALERIRGQFKERTWSAFLGTVLEGRTPKHVGEDLGMTQGAVRVAKSRVLQRLRAELGDLAP